MNAKDISATLRINVRTVYRHLVAAGCDTKSVEEEDLLQAWCHKTSGNGE
jgi:hypothetical protein